MLVGDSSVHPSWWLPGLSPLLLSCQPQSQEDRGLCRSLLGLGLLSQGQVPPDSSLEAAGAPPGPAGDLPQRRGQAGQVEGPGAAIAADELPAVPARSALVVVLLAQADTVLCGVGRATPPPHSSQNSPSAVPLGVLETLRPAGGAWDSAPQTAPYPVALSIC